MKMKRITNTLIIAAASLLAFSCQEHEVLDLQVNESIVLNLSSGLTKASDTDAEAYVNHLDVFIFEDVSGSPAGGKHYGRHSVKGIGNSITLNARRSSFPSEKRYHVYLIANSNLPESELASVVHYDDLVRKQTDQNIHITGLAVSDAPQYFLMDAVAMSGSTSPVQLNNGVISDNTVLDAVLERAAAKVFIEIKASPAVEFKPFNVSDGSDGGLYYIRNLPVDAYLLSETLDESLTKATKRTTQHSNNRYFTWNPETDPKNVTLTAYVYPNSWDDSSLLEEETCVIMNLPLNYTKDGVTTAHHNSWYKIPMTGEKVFRRNNYYHVQIDLNRPGATSETVPVDLTEIHYKVEDWTSEEIEVGGEDKPVYLMVNRKEMEMHNISKDDSTLEFASSSPVTVTVTDIHYYNKFGQKTSVSALIAAGISGTTEGGIAGNITVNSPVPVNNAIRYFTLVVTNQDGLSKTVDVTQYPLEYITGVVGSYSYRDDFFYPDGNSNDEDNQSAPTTWNVQGDRITSASWNGGGWTYQKGSTGGAFVSKVAYRMYTTGGNAGLADIDYYYYGSSYWGGVTKSRNNALDPGNPRMYHVQIKATSSTYTLGIPLLDSDGYTDSGSDNAKLVSPSFMLASQLGAVSSGAFDNYDMVASHCREYVEVYVDPETGDEVHLRDWRLPTRAEVEIIYKFQNDSEVMDEVLAGTRYWCADKGYVTNPSPTLSGTFLRCIRDVY